MGNTQASNAILAKARAMYGRRLTARNYQELLNCRDLPDLISYLKTRTSYSEALQAANPATTHRAQLETLLRLNLFEQYASLCRYEMNIGHDFYRYFIIRSEVQAITTRLQELHAPDGDVSIYTMPDFIKKHSWPESECHVHGYQLQNAGAGVGGNPLCQDPSALCR